MLKLFKINIQLKLLYALFALLFTANQIMAQGQLVLGKFLIAKAGNGVFLNWSIKAGSTCNGIEIERSTDSLNFTTIGNISGTCGSISEEISYNFTDNSPFLNTVNFYRLVFGGTQVSQTISIELIDIEKLGYQIRPHPLADNASLFFENAKNLQHQLEIRSLNGNLVHRSTTTESYFELQRSLLSAGLYYFIISDKSNNPVTKGNLLVQ